MLDLVSLMLVCQLIPMLYIQELINNMTSSPIEVTFTRSLNILNPRLEWNPL